MTGFTQPSSIREFTRETMSEPHVPTLGESVECFVSFFSRDDKLTLFFVVTTDQWVFCICGYWAVKSALVDPLPHEKFELVLKTGADKEAQKPFLFFAMFMGQVSDLAVPEQVFDSVNEGRFSGAVPTVNH